uniref:Uncharacterized protein n=1 Tax=Lepeophtheirus salmonis TaxID=72036 RepID=A0A0K2TG42_LEPSM
MFILNSNLSPLGTNVYNFKRNSLFHYVSFIISRKFSNRLCVYQWCIGRNGFSIVCISIIYYLSINTFFYFVFIKDESFLK